MARGQREWIMRGVLIGFLMLLSTTIALIPSQPSPAQAAPFLEGRSYGYGWVLDIHGSRGVFYAGELVWKIEYIFRARGLDGSTYQLWFLGRRPESFCILFISANEAGNNFFVEYYNYSENRYRGDRFSGAYDIRGIQANPTLMSDYLPEASIPPFMGSAFEISSPYAQITDKGGVVMTEDLKLQIYPLYHVIVTTSWQELWALGLDELDQHPYFLIFYTTDPMAWIIDLWDGQVQSRPLGQVHF